MTFRGTLAVVSLVALAACEKAEKISTGSLSGRAVYAGQSDHSGISVTAAGFTTTTDATGNYAFADVPVGRHAVTAIAPRSAERTLATTVSVSAGANTAPELTFSPMQVLAGQLTFMGAPLQGATVTLDGGAQATTDANGVYSFADARSGSHSLAFTSGAMSDAIPELLYSPAMGASVPAPYTYDALYRLEPFDLQGAKRVASVNVKVPVSRTLQYAPTLSPDGQLYFYGISNDQNLTSLYVGSVAGGAPVLVSAAAYSGTLPKFSTASGHLAFVRRNAITGRYDLCVTALGAGPSVGPVKVLTTMMNPGYSWDFSPQTTAALPSLYFIEYDSTNSVYSLREANVEGGGQNEWPGVTEFYISKKQKRVLIRQSGTGAAPNNRIVSVAATGASVGSTVAAYESQGSNTFGFTFYGFSPDESRFAYTISSPSNLAQQVGLKTGATTSASVVLLSADPSVYCVSFNPNGDRLTWVRAGNIVTRLANASAAEATYVAASPYFVCPVFTNDGRIWLNYYDGSHRIALANADGSGLTVAETQTDLTSVGFGQSAAYFTRGSGTTVSFWVRPLAATASTQADSTTDYGYLIGAARSGAGAFYAKREYLNSESYPYAVYWVGASGSTSRVGAAFYTLGFSSTDDSKALVWCYDEASYRYVTSVDVATGARKPLLRRVSTAKLQDVGATPAPKFIGFRQNSGMPYEFQDGVYVADP